MPLQPCDTCQHVYESRRRDQRFCSAKCRMAAFQQRRDQARTERDAKVRLLLHEALGLLEENGGHDNGR
jgi:hypothetical protein